MIRARIFKFFIRNLCHFKNLLYLCRRFGQETCCVVHAQMAESVDALVSNTSGATRAGSTPALGTNKREVNASLLSYPGPYFNLTPSNALPLVAWRPSGTALARILASPQYA